MILPWNSPAVTLKVQELKTRLIKQVEVENKILPKDIYKKVSRLKLLGVARGSLEELLNDYQDFIRQKGLPLWKPESLQARKVRALAYKSYKSYNDYKNYISDPEEAANCMVCLINQTNRLLDQKLRWLEERFVKEGGFRENLFKKRMEFRKRLLRL